MNLPMVWKKRDHYFLLCISWPYILREAWRVLRIHITILRYAQQKALRSYLDNLDFELQFLQDCKHLGLLVFGGSDYGYAQRAAALYLRRTHLRYLQGGHLPDPHLEARAAAPSPKQSDD
eukprot:CAMPEP_0201498730 /NCGR_PEP_ID=MMETSP0151_2-20130828/72648_1 /ASSEMBLY_ACC=CAM_ASM_000257 /TAXON_ID=200890 /ORGANISM="Paramoeba atlantica, Strain 621/1 / CCAP 1560/9" /LENGTH=119 /DNA_ID=CAMNT_0047890531 /DNA_START=220 /DNA_END=579 /DNA_ORIENTATION=+